MLFGRPVEDYIPYLATNFVIWNFISGTITDSTAVFVQAAGYMRQDALPKTIFVMRILVRNFMILAHNIIVVPITFAAFSVKPNLNLILFVPGLLLVALAGFAAALICGVLCTRFRDLPQIVQSLLQIAFFLTPVMWRPEQLPSATRFIVEINPFAAYLHVVTEPILGQVPNVSTYAAALAATAVLFAVALPLFARFRARIVYWL
jgi:ABC-type polysaccharide/polyol phosphate export permease